MSVGTAHAILMLAALIGGGLIIGGIASIGKQVSSTSEDLPPVSRRTRRRHPASRPETQPTSLRSAARHSTPMTPTRTTGRGVIDSATDRRRLSERHDPPAQNAIRIGWSERTVRRHWPPTTQPTDGRNASHPADHLQLS
jgi:hypothetical protein